MRRSRNVPWAGERAEDARRVAAARGLHLFRTGSAVALMAPRPSRWTIRAS